MHVVVSRFLFFCFFLTIRFLFICQWFAFIFAFPNFVFFTSDLPTQSVLQSQVSVCTMSVSAVLLRTFGLCGFVPPLACGITD